MKRLSNIKNRNTRNSFLVSCMLVVKKGSPRINDNGEEVETKLIEADDLKRFQGDTNGNKIHACRARARRRRTKDRALYDRKL